MEEVITKRIHISGLTPAITAKDLNDRLGSFGTVKSLDGLGLLDAVGQPRKFAYATLETTKAKLARCMNLLSGVTWKGAKLRLGEAKPDFRERIAQEHAAIKRAAEEAANQPPKKRRRLPRGVQGVHAADMTPVTPENVKTRGGWRVTATGRLIRPMRMRPERPLPEPLDAAAADKTKGKTGKAKKRLRDPPTRARRRTIDPTKWGSTHLKGIFLENAAASVASNLPRESIEASSDAEEELDASDEEYTDEGSSGEESSEDTDSESSEGEELADDGHSILPPSSGVSSKKPSTGPSTLPSNSLQSAEPSELVEETSKALSLLQSLFGDKDEWRGEESIDSDIDEEDIRRADAALEAVADSPEATDAAGDVAANAMQVDVQERTQEAAPVQSSVQTQPQGTQKTKLKDLFAPREEDAGFSLLGHLDLDLELEEDLPFDVPASAPAPASAPSQPVRTIQPTAAHLARTAALDVSKPLFFPSDNVAMRRRALDPTNWRTWFFRTDSPEAIKQRWEESKGELTAGWKRRHREAIKSRRRRGGGAGEGD
ncbi:hypothetical protein PYCCODRAFT_1465336 [Trametes coccinea BRFM310]|uniref:RRM domain-containing protein n=1 Tax=Trametes coccinea (strain BRFM310) TaxID=1353009 RepID=A0A1Y2IWC8_TRAC3|nr:hypothetical protein PYCCODRAFT_1465336 [Trametes coccinea BRFM310]